jgi:hypothetical protein
VHSAKEKRKTIKISGPPGDDIYITTLEYYEVLLTAYQEENGNAISNSSDTGRGGTETDEVTIHM